MKDLFCVIESYLCEHRSTISSTTQQQGNLEGLRAKTSCCFVLFSNCVYNMLMKITFNIIDVVGSYEPHNIITFR